MEINNENSSTSFPRDGPQKENYPQLKSTRTHHLDASRNGSLSSSRRASTDSDKTSSSPSLGKIVPYSKGMELLTVAPLGRKIINETDAVPRDREPITNTQREHRREADSYLPGLQKTLQSALGRKTAERRRTLENEDSMTKQKVPVSGAQKDDVDGLDTSRYPNPRTPLNVIGERKMADTARREEEAKAYLSENSNPKGTRPQSSAEAITVTGKKQPSNQSSSTPVGDLISKGSPMFDKPGSTIPGLQAAAAAANRANRETATLSQQLILNDLKEKVRESQKRKREQVSTEDSSIATAKVKHTVLTPSPTEPPTPVTSRRLHIDTSNMQHEIQICRFWKEGTCRFSAKDCRYLHSIAPSSTPSSTSLKTCFYWARTPQGCRHSAQQCPFLHKESDAGIAHPPSGYVEPFSPIFPSRSAEPKPDKRRRRGSDDSEEEGEVSEQDEVNTKDAMDDIYRLIANHSRVGEDDNRSGSEEDGEVREVKRVKTF